jgi:hypothetical protein
MRYKAMKICDYTWYGELLNDAKRFGIAIPVLPEDKRINMVNYFAGLLKN